MIVLSQEMKEMIASQQCFVGTVNEDGTPNVAPKRSTRVFSDDSLIFNEGTGGKTWDNVRRGSKVAVSVVNREILDGFRFIGVPEVIENGAVYDAAAEMAEKMGFRKPLAVVIIKIEEIHSLKPGPMAGKRIA